MLFFNKKLGMDRKSGLFMSDIRISSNNLVGCSARYPGPILPYIQYLAGYSAPYPVPTWPYIQYSIIYPLSDSIFGFQYHISGIWPVIQYLSGRISSILSYV